MTRSGLSSVVLGFSVAACSGGSVTTLAGSVESGYVDGSGSAARFASASSLVVGADGTLYVADAENNAIRRVAGDGTVSTLVRSTVTTGLVDGPPGTARLFLPIALAFDGEGQLVVGEGGNHALRRVDPGTGNVTTIAGGVEGYVDGPLASARFGAPTAIAIDTATGVIFFTDSTHHVVRRIDERSGMVSTVAGSGVAGSADGLGTAANFNRPVGLARDADGSLWVADTLNETIRHIDASGNVTTVAGRTGVPGYAEGSGDGARFNNPWGIALVGRTLYVADGWNHVIRALDGGSTSHVAGAPASVPSPLPAGQDGSLDAATFRLPSAVAERDGVLYVAESTRVREILR